MPPAPADVSAIYFTVETYLYQIIPKKCTEGSYTYDDGAVENHFSPKYNYSVKRGGTYHSGEFCGNQDYSHRPVLIPEGGVSNDEVIELHMEYWWYESPGKDSTVALYSDMDIVLTDLAPDNAAAKTSILYTDGRLPTEWTESLFRGMNPEANGAGGSTPGMDDLFNAILSGDVLSLVNIVMEMVMNMIMEMLGMGP